MLKRPLIIPISSLILIVFALSGCSSFDGTILGSGQSDRSQPSLSLTSGMSLGQTFTTRQNGLMCVEVFLEPQPSRDGQIQLKLYSGPQETTPITQAILPIDSNSPAGWYRFTFLPNPKQNPSDFYFTLQFEGSGAVNVASSSGATYVEGSAYQDGLPLQDAQLAFQLEYDRGMLLLGLLSQGLKWLLWLGLAGLLFVLPGWVLLGSLWNEWPGFFFGERLGLSIGVSLAIYPLLFLWTYLVGLHLGIFYAVLPPGVAVIFLLFKAIKGIYKNKSSIFSIPLRLPQINLADLTYLLMIGLILGVRLYIARPLSLPLWGDSYQHTVITQLLMDNKGLFQSWQPYADMVGLTYHFGFHSQSAVFGWLANLNASQAVIWFGQILNGLAVLALYPLAVRLCRNRWAGVIATMVGGLLVSMPMFYINWGRYTQLAGQAILPAVICLALSALKVEEKKLKIILLAGLTIGGLALTHYRVLILAVLFFIPSLLLENESKWSTRILRTVQIGLVGGLLFLPWFIHIYGGNILKSLGVKLATPASAISAFTEQYNAPGPLTDYLPIGIWLLLIVAVAWGLWRRERFTAILAVWFLVVILATNPGWLGLPGAGAISNFAILIAVYIPAGVFLGAAGGWLLEMLPFNHRTIFSFAIMVGLVALGIWGGRQRLGDAQFNQFTIAARPDLRASAWIRTNLPQDANFLVNAFSAYGGSVMAGSDGGWWLHFLSGHQTTLPPLLYSTEPAPDPGYVQSINSLMNLVYDKGIGAPETLAELDLRGVNYIYIGQLQGHSGYGGPYPLEPENLLSNQHFKPVYHQDRVWIFEIKP